MMSGEVTKAFLDEIENGLQAALDKLDQLYQLEAYAEKLPIIGTALSTSAQALQSLTLLRDAVKTAVDQVSNLDLATLNTAQVQSELNTRLSNAMASLSAYGFAGTAVATVNSSGHVSITLDSGRTFTQSFTPGDLGMSGLGLNLQGTGTAALSYNLDFRIGRDGTGFYLDTGGTDLSIGAKVNLGSLSATADLGPLRFTASNITDSDPVAGADTLNLAIGTMWNQTGLVRAFTTDLIDFRATGDVDLDIALAANMGSAALPSISANLHVDWGFNNSLLNGAAGNSWSGAQINFSDVRYDFGTFASRVIQPILAQLTPLLGPINTALAVFRTDISGVLLPEWAATLDVVPDPAPGHQVTLLDFLQLAANVSGQSIDLSGLASLIDTLDRIVDFAEFFTGRTFSDDAYQIGNWQYLLTDVQGAANQLAGVDVNAGFTSSAPNIVQFLNNLEALGRTGFAATHNGAVSPGGSGADLIASLVGDPTLAFPLLEDPKNVIRLLLGQDVDFFRLDLPAINIALGMNAAGQVTSPLNVLTLPIWPIPLVTANLGVAAQAVIDLAFGWDSSGLKQYALGGFTDPSLVFDGFYLNDQRSGVTDIPEVVIRAAIDFVIDANFLGASIGGGGNLIGELTLDLADALTNAQGKLYVTDLPGAFQTNPFSIFDVGGKLTAGLRAYVNSPLGNIWSYSSPRVTLANFSAVEDAAPPGPPPGLASVISGDQLWLSVGPLSTQRTIANTADGAEVFEVSVGSGGTIVVSAFDTAQSFTGIARIEADGGAGADELVVAAGVLLPARMSGGAGADYLAGGGGDDRLYGGIEDDYLSGGVGSDQLYGEDGNDYLEGGAGADQLFGGAGLYDFATYANSAAGITLNLTTGVHGGDAAGDTFDQIEIFEGSRNADSMTGSAGADILSALAGDDTLSGMGGDDTLAGGPGTNVIDGGEGYDIVNYFNLTAGVTVAMTGTSGTVTGTGLSDTLTNVEQVDGSVHGDTMTGGAGTQVFVGREGNDTLDGGEGNDTLMGGLGADTLIGGEGNDRASYAFATAGVTLNLASGGTGGEAAGDTYSGIETVVGSAYNDTVTGDSLDNLLQGGAGDDTLNGAGGNDILDGGLGADAMNGGTGRDRATYIYSTTWLVLNLQTGVHQNDATGDSFTDVEVWQGTAFSDTMTGSDARGEELWGAGGSDTIRGGGGDDVLMGDADDDSLHGDAGADTLDGGSGRDELLGGTGNDTLIGGSEGDTLSGEGDDDTLQGGTGNDVLNGGADNDTLWGGDGDDALDGGSGRDRIDFSAATAAVQLNLSGTQRTLAGFTVAAFTARDGSGGIDTIAASAGLSTIEDARGSNFGDTIVASEGGSTIEGLDGADTLTGLAGDDVLRGGADGDTIDGGDGNDVVLGGTGSDVLQGGGGTADWVSFEDIGGSVTASLHAGTATKSIGGGAVILDFENLRGGAGNDTLTGDTGSNRIEGLGGDDRLDGWAGADTLVGGTGNDIYFVDNASGDPTQASDDTIIEESGNDLVRSAVNYALGSGLEDLELVGQARIGTGNGVGNLMLGNALDNVLDGLSGGDTFWGYAGNDIYYFDSLSDSIGIGSAPRGATSGDGEVAGGGTDEIRLATAQIYGVNPNLTTYEWTYTLDQAGFQQVENLVLIDNARAVHLTGNALDNYLKGNSFNQLLRGGDGNDRLDPGTGIDTVEGGAGNDTLVIDWSSVTDYVFNIASIAGTLTGGYSGEIYNNQQLAERFRVYYSGIENFDVRLGQQSDVLRAGDGNDRAFGEGGDDYLITGRGHDVVDGGTGNDRWVANKSAAITDIVIDLRSGTWTYVMPTGTGSVTNIEALGGGAGPGYEGYFETGSGNDTLTTHTGRFYDFIATNGGDDRVTLFSGVDTVDMGTGTDTLVIDWSGVTDYVFNISALSGSLAAGYSGDLYNNQQLGDRNRAIFYGVEHFDVTLGGMDDVLRTGDGNDRAIGGDGNDYLITGRGVDVVDGGAGIDRWTADKSAATSDITIDLRSGTWTYAMPNGTGSVTGIEALGSSLGTLYETGFLTGSGNDTITTATLHLSDFLLTGDGNDRVTLFAGVDAADMGGGTDTLVIDWSYVTDYVFNISSLSGSLIAGYSGDLYNNQQLAERNRATFFGVEHFDIKLGALGDFLRTGDGNDTVSGGGGDDHLITGRGVDTIDGGAGTADRWEADKSFATAAQAIVIDLTQTLQSTYLGGATVRGIEALSLSTGAGADTIITLSSHLTDVLDTGDGHDTVKVAGGIDTVAMGSGFDTLIVDWSAMTGYDINISSLAGSYAAGYSGELYNSQQLAERNRVSFSGVERFDIATGDGNDRVATGGGDDRVVTGAGNDYLLTGQGEDTVDGGVGNDYWLADKSTVSADITLNLNSAATQAYIAGNATATARGIEALGGEAAFLTGSGNDTITTHATFFNDWIATGAGNDTITLLAGIDNVGGGDGTDRLVIDWSNASGFDFNVASLGGTLAGGYFGEFYNNFQLGDRNRANFSGIESFDLRFGAGNDTMRTGDGDDSLSGGGGHDALYSGKGADMIDGGDGVDLWNGDQGDYTGPIALDLNLAGIQATFGTSTIRGIERIELTTGSGNDTITTHATFQNDVVVAGAGNDTITLLAGIDNVGGGDGTDRLVIDWSNASGYDFNIASLSGSLAAGYSGEFYNNFQLGDRNRANFSGIESFDLRYGAGNDTMRTGDGDDSLSGGAGHDYLEAGGGNDWLDGGTGNDTMVGGAGNDTYIVDSVGDVVAEGASGGFDTVHVGFASYTLATDLEGIVGTGAAGQRLTGNAADNRITGSAFDDVIDGAAGNDVMIGGAGNDRFLAGTGAADTIDGGIGDDTLVLVGYANSFEFTDLGGGQVRVRDLRNPANATMTITSVEFVELTNGRYTIAQALAGAIPAAAAFGTTGNETITAPNPGALVDASQGGDDIVIGSSGNEGFYFGAAFTAADRIDGGAGTNDQIALQGDYTGARAVTLAPTTITNVEVIAMLPGYGYEITTVDANVGAGQRLYFYAGAQGAGDSFTLNGAAETDGTFFVYGGGGRDTVTTGAGNDAVYFGPGTFNPATDVVNAGAGTNDQVGLDGDYAITVSGTNLIGVEVLALLGGRPDDAADYVLTVANDWAGAGQRKTIYGAAVSAPLSIDGSAETDGSLAYYAGMGADTLIGSGGGDFIFGNLGGDVITPGGGADLLFYNGAADSTGSAFDRIFGFAAEDRITIAGRQVTAIDPTVAGGSLSAATIDVDLTAALGAGQLGIGHAVVFTPNAGDRAGTTWLVVDLNGQAGYQAGQDLVVELVAPTTAIGLGQFV